MSNVGETFLQVHREREAEAARGANPFLADLADDAPLGGPELRQGPRPSLAERFAINFEAGSRYNTIGRAVQDHATDFRLRERRRFDARYESFPQWENPLEGAAALAGQLAGTATGIENYTPIGAGNLAVKGLAWSSTALRSRVLAGAVDAAASNLVIDSAIQGIEVAGGTRDEFSGTQLAASTALGAVAGGALGPLARGGNQPETPEFRASQGGAPPNGNQSNPFLDDIGVSNDAPARQLAPREPGLPVAEGPSLAPRPGQAAALPAAGQAAQVLSGPAARTGLPAPGERPAINLPDETPDGSVIIAEAAEDIALGDRLAAKARQVRNLFRPEGAAPEPGAARADMSDVDGVMRAQIEATRPKRIPGGRPMSLSRFLAANGGLAKDEGGDLASILGRQNLYVPGYGSLIRNDTGPLSTAAKRSGRSRPMTLDRARELAVEAGYIADQGDVTGGLSSTTTRDLLDALDSELRGKPVYSAHDIAEWDNYDAAISAYDEALTRLDQSLAEIADVVIDDMPVEIRQRAVEIHMRDGGDAFAALERAVLEDYYASEAATPLTRQDGKDIADEFEIPGWDEASLDAVDARGSAGQRGQAGAGGQRAGGPGPDRPAQPDGQGAAAAGADQGSAGGAPETLEQFAKRIRAEFKAGRQADIAGLEADLKYFSGKPKGIVGPSGINYSTEVFGIRDKAARIKQIKQRIKENIDYKKSQASDISDDLIAKSYKVHMLGFDLNRQSSIPGSEGLSPAQLAQRQADAPLQARAPQNFQMDDGLFGDSMNQRELFSTDAAGAGAPSRRDGGTLSNAPFTRLKDVTEALRDLVGVASVRQGVTKPGRKGVQIQGTFNTRTGGIRIRSQDDFDTFTHEVGHDIDQKLGAPLRALMDGHKREVEALAYPGTPDGQELSEGFAEFFRLYLTNPAYARQQAPQFFEQFDTFLQQQDADLAAGLGQVREAYRAWLSQPSDQAVASTIVSARKGGFVSQLGKDARRHGLANSIADRLQHAYGALLDRQHGLNRAVSALAEIHRENTGQALDLKVADDPYKLARLTRGAHNAGHMDIYFGVAPYKGARPETPSLRDALIKAFKASNSFSRWSDEQAAEFGAYLWSRRALGEWDRFDAGLIPNAPDKLTRGDHQVNIDTMEARNPQYREAAAMVHQWARGLWKKKYEAGLITREQYDEGLLIRDYVPGLRSFDYDGDTATRKAGSKSGGGLSSFVKQFRGSRRDVINPIDSLMADAYETNMAIARNDVLKAMSALADLAGPGSAAIAERVPAMKVLPNMVNPGEAVLAAAKRSGMDQADALGVRDAFEAAFGADEVAVFRPAVINDNGQPIAFYRDGGKLQALRLADGDLGQQMYNALTAMGPQERNFLVSLFAVPAAVLRAGITTTLEFIKANAIRDFTISWVYYGKPGHRAANTLRGTADELFQRQVTQEYARGGGIMGGAATASMRDAVFNADMRALKKKGWAAQRLTSFKGWLEISELSETGVRLGLFRTFKDEALKRGLDENEAILEAAFRARDHMDFDRHGWLLGPLSRIIPFLNASLQGMDKTARQMIAPLARRMAGEPPLKGDEAAMGEAVKAWARLTTLGVLGMSLHVLNRSNPEYDEISTQTRATHWMVKTGDKWYAVPKPFEMAAWLNGFEAVFDAYASNDQIAAERYREGLFSVVAPPNVFEGNPALRYYFERKSGQDFFTGQPILPDQLQGLEPWLQYTARTSAFSKQLGELTGISPVQADHFITTFLGGHGRNALAAYDWAASDKPLPGWDDAPIVRRFIKDASRGASSSKAFWELIGNRTGQLEGAARSYRLLFENGDPGRARELLGRADAVTRDYVTVAMMEAGARRIHPMLRARAAVQSINQLRREISGPEYTGADGAKRTLDAINRRAADDILASMAMAEARNALVTTGVRGWEMRQPFDMTTFQRELQAVDPALADALAARFATNKVIPAETVQQLWPQLRDRLRADGSEAITLDLEKAAEATGYEMGGVRLPTKRERPPVDAVQ